ncbi:MAG: type I signal peptidase [uncultured bacterium]|nr:MAG: type I signal peptidase [uncultured bacterium]HBR78967.1 signal peptidase I [Candidatus Moranbacteria bacterium]
MFFKIISYLIKIVYLVLAMIVIVAAFSFLPMKNNFKMLVVLSGSMEPKIHTGSLIFIKSVNEYNIGDIVTRRTEEGVTTITHRIIEKDFKDGQTIFNTKGDANNTADNVDVKQEFITGKVFFNIPYLGYAVNFAKTTQGLILIVVIPAVIIVHEEILKIKKEIVRIVREKKGKESKEEDGKLINNE